jgi:integrase
MNLDELLEAHKAAYFATPKRQSSIQTYNTDFANIYKKIPRNQPFTPELLRQTLEAIPDDTCVRKRAANAFQKLAILAGFDIDLMALSGRYSSRRPKERILPSDEEIAKFFPTIKNDYWRWVYGAIAVYGLRPHEAFFTRINPDGTANVTQGKTGPRKIWPYLPEWFYEFNIATKRLPPVTIENRPYAAIGRTTLKYLRHYAQCPFQIYNLRHAWAVRVMDLGLKDTLAAKQMGHSVKVHQEIYQRWINEREHEAAFQQILKNRSRGR